SGEAAFAAPAAEHGVADDVPAEPCRIDVRADRGDHARPLVADPQRVAGLAGVQVVHIAGEHLDVGAADAGPGDVDDDQAGAGHGVLDLADLGPRGSGEDERSHAATSAVAA